MKKKIDEIETKAITINNSATNSNGISYIYNDRTDSNKLKIGRGTVLGNNVTLTINEEGKVGVGTTNPQTPLDISEMGGLVIAEQYQHDASTGVFVDLTTTMGAPTGAPSITFICPANGKVKIQISGYVVHSGQPTESHTTAEVAIHDGSGYVYDIDGIQLDSQQFWASVGDNYMQTIEFIITKDSSDVALVPGTSYTFQSHWRGSINTEIKIYYGANMPPLIMRAVTVPNTIL